MSGPSIRSPRPSHKSKSKISKNKYNSNTILRKPKINHDSKTRKILKADISTHPDPTKCSKKELYKALSAPISDEELDNKALVIISIFKYNKKMIYSALYKHLYSQNCEKLSKL
jgi:hypothetical protein